MLIDRGHRVWAVATLAMTVVATGCYVWYANHWPGGPAGRTWPGMLFGVVGTALMLFAGLLSARKKMIRQRLGSLSWWLKGHIWLGLLSVPILFFHTAMRWGGTLELLLMLLFLTVILSGILGLVLQNILPRMMKTLLPTEAIPDQINYLCGKLQAEADNEVIAACGDDAFAAAGERSGSSSSTSSADLKRWLADLHLTLVRPYLGSDTARGSTLGTRRRAELIFERARSSLPEALQATVNSLEEKCNVRRQLRSQSRLYLLLHGWLRVHIPLSVGLLVLTIAHIVTALYY